MSDLALELLYTEIEMSCFTFIGTTDPPSMLTPSQIAETLGILNNHLQTVSQNSLPNLGMLPAIPSTEYISMEEIVGRS